jgi:homoserine kinase
LDQVTVFAPGSISNLGAGFDCLGAAIGGKGDRVTARRSADSGQVRVVSVSDPRIPLDVQRNTAALAAGAVLGRSGSPAGIELAIEKGLPLAGGMGGSAASAVAGAVAANALIEAELPRAALFEAALQAEAVVAGRHGDNVAPSLLGGAVLIVSLDPLELATVDVHPSVGLVLVTPDYQVPTAEARRVLPTAVPRVDAIAQAAHLAALVLGLERGDPDLVRSSMTDRIAEPARAALYPGYAEARVAALEAGACGVAVSGAGPTVMALARQPLASAVGEAFAEAYRRQGYQAVTHVAQIDPLGARVVS